MLTPRLQNSRRDHTRERGRKLHGWRKLAGSFWGAPNDPQFYGDLEIDAGTLMQHLDQLRERTGTHVTVTHAVGRAVAHGLDSVPDLRVRLARGREYERESTNVFFIVAAEGGELTGCKVDRANEKSLVEIAEELETSRSAISSGSDASFGKAKKMLDLLPSRLLRPAMNFSAFLTSDLNLDLPALGLRRQAFGSAMITSVGMWGISRAYSPLAGYYRVPVLVLVGAVTERPVAVSGQVVIRPMLTLTATFDHRYADGFQAAKFAQAVQEYCRDPASFETP
jgi:pyruvate/2-oxoglutarate dehydrogenase complex dihydrolipoamide acyltransferase (E2) component